MKFVRINPDQHTGEPIKFIYDVPDNIINERFGNIYILQKYLVDDNVDAVSWVDDILKHHSVGVEFLENIVDD